MASSKTSKKRDRIKNPQREFLSKTNKTCLLMTGPCIYLGKKIHNTKEPNRITIVTGRPFSKIWHVTQEAATDLFGELVRVLKDPSSYSSKEPSMSLVTFVCVQPCFYRCVPKTFGGMHQSLVFQKINSSFQFG